jgi:hypothetical protein
MVNSCTKDDERHTDDCDGNCEKVEAPDSVVDLHNELIEWNKREMIFQGVPAALAGGPFPGVSVEILELECRFAGLIEYLTNEWPEFDQELASDYYRKVMISKMKGTREQFDQAKKQSEIAIAQTPLLGPNGEVIH